MKDWQPCPFCRSTRVRLHTYRGHGEHHVVLCLALGCEARGPRRYSTQEAIDAWNARGKPLLNLVKWTNS